MDKENLRNIHKLWPFKVSHKDNSEAGDLDDQGVQPAISKRRKMQAINKFEEVKYIKELPRIPVDVRDTWHIRPQDLQAFMHALEDFAKQWE